MNLVYHLFSHRSNKMFRDKNGLITVDSEGTSAENSFLWTVELYIVQYLKGYEVATLGHTIDRALSEMYLGNGLYKQAPHIDLDQGKDSYMSHDQLTAIVCYLKLRGRKDKIKEILKATKFGLSYNNVDNKLRLLHPRDIIFYHIMSGSILAYLFLPILWLITIFTFYKTTKTRNGVEFNKTDGELLYYIKRASTGVFKPINFYCEFRVSQRFGDWDSLFHTYFKEPKHPINLIENK